MGRACLVVFDSLRKDVFDACRHPLLERWRERGTVFENCFSQSGFTLISFASLLSGRFPSRTGVRSDGPPLLASGARERGASPVWWSLDDRAGTRLVLEGSRALARSAFSLFEHRLFTLPFSKTNAFPELSPDEMTPSLEYGSRFTAFYDRFERICRERDFLIVLRIYDTHLPYGRGISPCDAPAPAEIKKKIASFFAPDRGRFLREEVAVKALERACDYLRVLWRRLEHRVDFLAVMSDHGDEWSEDPRRVGHAAFLTESVLRVPLVVMDRTHCGRSAAFCNNADVLPALLEATSKKAAGPLDGTGLPFDGAPRPDFAFEASSIRGERRTAAPAS